MISGNKRAKARIVLLTMLLFACVVALGPGLAGAQALPAAEAAFALPLDPGHLVVGGLVVLAAQLALVFGLLVHRAHRRRAEGEVRQLEAHNSGLAGRLIVNQESERSRLARDLHDGPCQEVAAVSVEISRLLYSRGSDDDAQATLSDVYGRIAGLAESLRRLSHDLHPSVLQHVGLVAALGAHCAEVERLYDMQVSLTVSRDLEAGDPVTALSIFRITQEALRNAARHGKARRASVVLQRDENGLTLSVVDDGTGFDIVDARRKDGLGLVSMAERARLVKGSFTIVSTPGEGTSVTVRVPVPAGMAPTGQVRPPGQRRGVGGKVRNVVA